jgi:TRAP-type C4-dicarboxylate transport system permease small subunit
MKTNFIKTQDPLKDEKIVQSVGYVILVIGIIAAGILIIMGFSQYEESYRGDTPVNYILITTGVGVALSSLAISGILVMLANISTTLKNR